MNPQTKLSEPSTLNSPDEIPNFKPPVDVKVEESGSLATISSSDKSTDQWQQIWDQVVAILSELPAYVSSFFSEYQRPIVTVGAFVAFLIAIKVTLAAVDAINDIPLLAPIFELIGLGYSVWFIYRYLLLGSTRQELWQQVKAFTDQVVGKGSSKF